MNYKYICGSCGIESMSDTPFEVKVDDEMISRNMNRLNRLISDILDISKIRSKILKLALNKGDINESIKNIKEITDKINTKEFAELLRSTEKLVTSSQETVDHFDKTFLLGRSNLLKSIELFKEALENINEFAILLKDNPDILIKGKESE